MSDLPIWKLKETKLDICARNTEKLRMRVRSGSKPFHRENFHLILMKGDLRINPPPT